jgi:hypothetical protein
LACDSRGQIRDALKIWEQGCGLSVRKEGVPALIVYKNQINLEVLDVKSVYIESSEVWSAGEMQNL